jgi:amidase
MARTTQDLERVLPLFVAQEAGAPAAGTIPPLGHSKDVSLDQLRIAYFTRWGHDHGTPTPAIQEAVEEAATALARRGASVKQDRPSFFDQIDDVLDSWLLERSPADVYRKEMEKLGLGDDPQVEAHVIFFERRMREISPKMVPVHAAKFPDLQKQVRSFMEDYDLLITPVAAVSAVKHRTLMKNKASSDGLSYCAIANMTDSLPAGTVRVTTSPDGLPIGVNLVGRAFREDIVLRVLAEMESASGGWQPPDL